MLRHYTFLFFFSSANDSPCLMNTHNRATHYLSWKSSTRSIRCVYWFASRSRFDMFEAIRLWCPIVAHLLVMRAVWPLVFCLELSQAVLQRRLLLEMCVCVCVCQTLFHYLHSIYTSSGVGLPTPCSLLFSRFFPTIHFLSLLIFADTVNIHHAYYSIGVQFLGLRPTWDSLSLAGRKV
jgi:hypothetical protein